MSAHTQFARIVLVAMILLPRAAGAAEVTRVVSALDDDNRFDFNLTLSWQHDSKSALVKRELQSDLATRTELVRDVKFAETRDVLNLRAEFGILWDVGLHVEAPLVLGEQNTLELDQSDGAGCIFPDAPERPTCVNSSNSTILRDHILPGYGASTYGLDSEHPAAPFSSPDTRVFRSPRRRGLEYLNVGVAWAAFNQLRDDTKPTWMLGFDAKLDLFRDRRFDPANPGANTAVGPGYHQFVWSTFVSKRFRHFDPYFGAWYLLPVRTNGSPFQQYPGDNQGAVNPQHRGGVVIGVEEIAWENARGDQRVTIEVQGRAEQRFFGRSHSEIWEPLTGSSLCASDTDPARPHCRPGLDEDMNGDGRPDPFPGVTETQPFATFGGNLGLNVEVGKHVRFRGLFGLMMDMPHFITFANSGVDRSGDGVVDSNDPTEANPTYRENIDLPGRRFKVEGTQIWSLFLEGSILF